MKIENRGVRITDIPVFNSIEVEQGVFVIQEGDLYRRLSLIEFTQLRNALDAALEEHAKFDTAMTAPVHIHRASCRGPIGELQCGER